MWSWASKRSPRRRRRGRGRDARHRRRRQGRSHRAPRCASRRPRRHSTPHQVPRPVFSVTVAPDNGMQQPQQRRRRRRPPPTVHARATKAAAARGGAAASRRARAAPVGRHDSTHVDERTAGRRKFTTRWLLNTAGPATPTCANSCSTGCGRRGVWGYHQLVAARGRRRSHRGAILMLSCGYI